ncbi:LPS O-antigen chain length determinant protein WzzB [Corticimicrobacter populi]|nr:Wzz/FepE/Etk N-terminal domain-containing protein [Corticimicrobacter populi]
MSHLPEPHSRATTPTNEIDLLVLARAIWSHKYLLLAYIVGAIILAALYVFIIATPRYAVSVYVDAPFSGNLAQLNKGRGPAGLEPYTPGQVFAYFTRRLGSDEAFQRYLQITLQHPDGTTLPASELAGNDWRVSIDAPQPKGRNLYKITVQDNTSQAAYDGLVRYLNLARSQAADTLIDDARQSIALSIRNIERTLDEHRQVTREKREDRTQRLTEALAVARAIGLQQPQLTLAQPPSQDALRPYLDGSELYARGIKALEAELAVLKARENDDPFISNLREEQARLRLLQEIDIQLDNVHLFRFDGEVIQPEKPVHPKKKMILVLAVLLGSMLGVLHILWQRILRSGTAF